MKNIPDLRRSDSRNPFGNLQRQVGRLFEVFYSPILSGLGGDFTPSCDVEETDSHYLMSFDLPGVKKDDITVNLKDGLLTVYGERKEERKKEERNLTRNERFYGSFQRSFSVPTDIQADQIEANYADGVLELAVPKGEDSQTQKVKIGEGKPGFLERLTGKKKTTSVQEKSRAA